MAFASGTFSLYTPGNPVVTGTTIASTWANNTLNDIATGLSTCLLKDGSQTVTANIPMSSFKITGLAAATARTDAASLASIQDGTGVYVSTVGGSANAITLTPSPAITAYSAGQAFIFAPASTNTAATTVAVSGLASPKNIFAGNSALVGGELHASIPAKIVYDGTQSQLLGPVSRQPTTTTLTSGSSATYTTPTGATRLYVRLVGGGGGGSAQTTNAGTAGNNTTFGSLTGGGGGGGQINGVGAGGTSSGGINIPGGAGQGASGTTTANTFVPGGQGGSSYFGGAGYGGNAAAAGGDAATNSGSGGGGAGGASGGNSGSGGGAGGYVELLVIGPSATYTYTVGAAANGGAAGGVKGGNGAAGIIIVQEYYD